MSGLRKFGLRVLLIIAAVPVLLPFLWMGATSLKPITEVNVFPPTWISPNMTIEPYIDMFSFLPFATYTLNSLVVALGATTLTLVVGSLAAFAFARFRFRGSRLLLAVFLLFAFLGSWNEFFFALLLTASDSARTIPVGIGLFVGEYRDVWNQMAAAAVLFSIPPLILFLLARKTFVKGLAAGAIK